MNSDIAIRLQNVGKCYGAGGHPVRHMIDLLRGRASAAEGFWAVRGVSLQIWRGEAIGIVGHNGAGKSTLLQLVAGTLRPTEGSIAVAGRVTALLELGAGFNPEFSGRENVFLAAAMSGLSREEIAQRFDAIVAFSGIEEFIERPVKTYSSGMLVRLAFSVAMHVDPDVLIIDEALSVGDGEFARRSFDRIMQFREAGRTLLFCSHSLYQIEALCDRAVWLDHGQLKLEGPPAEVTMAYDAALNAKARAQTGAAAAPIQRPAETTGGSAQRGSGRLTSVKLNAEEFTSTESDLTIDVGFASDPELPDPSVAICVLTADGRTVTSTSTLVDGVVPRRDSLGNGRVRLTIPKLPLLKGVYSLEAYLMCERGLHIYDYALGAARFTVRQLGLELGLFVLPRRWESV